MGVTLIFKKTRSEKFRPEFRKASCADEVRDDNHEGYGYQVEGKNGKPLIVVGTDRQQIAEIIDAKQGGK